VVRSHALPAGLPEASRSVPGKTEYNTASPDVAAVRASPSSAHLTERMSPLAAASRQGPALLAAHKAAAQARESLERVSSQSSAAVAAAYRLESMVAYRPELEASAVAYTQASWAVLAAVYTSQLAVADSMVAGADWAPPVSVCL
jgi:hypothetical protein